MIITYYWPPSGGITVLRCLKFAKYLRDFGWEPVIFTAENAHYPSIDHSNNKDIPDGVEIIRQKIWEPYSLYKLFAGKKKDANVNNIFYTTDEKAGKLQKLAIWIRSNFFIPDARAMWIKPSVKFLSKWLEENKVDAIFSDGPPHTNTRIATLIKKKTNIPWLADFQDPWTQVDYYALLNLTKRGDAKHRRMEQDVFKNADQISIVSNHWKEELKSIGAKNVEVIPYGFDPDDYKELKHRKSEQFIISHIGIMGYDRNPITFFKTIKSFIDENKEFAARLRIKFAGQVDYSVKEIIEDLQLTDQVDFIGNVSRSEALQLIKNSHLLLLLLNKQENAKGRIPGKLFEYLGVKRSILCLGDTNGDAADIIRKTGSGECFEYEDMPNLSKLIQTKFDLFIDQKLHQDIQSNIEAYSNIRLTERLAKSLDNMILKYKP